MADMIRWDEIDRMHVISRLKELVGRWWEVQINFTDKTGFLRNVKEGKFFEPLSSIGQAITASDRGFQDALNDARKLTVEAMGAKRSKTLKSTSGFSVILVPIKLSGGYVGCVFGDGFILQETLEDQKSRICNYLERVLPDQAEELKTQVDKIPVLSKKDVTYLTELIELVVDEVVVLNEDISKQKKKVDQLSGELGERYGFDQMIGKSAPMQAMYRLLDRVCNADSTVLVQGENGTGKELIAKALHYNSKRKDNKFLVVNCGAFNENLLESELFGHMKGSFTGAVKDKKGLFEAAHQGTLFLDEIGETSLTMQVKLLRVLQEGTFTPVGSTDMKKSNVRVLAATNRDLTKMVSEGAFREDLFYRLNVINIVVPPLRKRKEDIPLLVDHFLSKNVRRKNEKKTIAKECMEKLLNHDWRGNVRELENEIERLTVLSGDDKELTSDLLSPRIADSVKNQFPGLRVHGRLKDAIEQLERQMITEGLNRTGWNKSKLAKELGISRAGLIIKVEKYGLEKRKIS